MALTEQVADQPLVCRQRDFRVRDGETRECRASPPAAAQPHAETGPTRLPPLRGGQAETGKGGGRFLALL